VATRFKGEFDVKLIPQPSDDPSTGRMIIETEYHGDLGGTAKGQMLTGGGEVKDCGVYVAIEKVTVDFVRVSAAFDHRGVARLARTGAKRHHQILAGGESRTESATARPAPPVE